MRTAHVFAFVLLATPIAVLASSHREAPGIAQDPAADPTDLHVFRSPSDDAAAGNTVTILASFWPFQEPGGGPLFYQFSDDVLYAIHVDNDGDLEDDVSWEFEFETKMAAGGQMTVYANGPLDTPDSASRNILQTAAITRVDKKGRAAHKGKAPVAPSYTGAAVFPSSGAKTSDQVYEEVAQKAVTTLTTKGGGRVFLGPRDDPYFADRGMLYDLLQARGGLGKPGGIDFHAGYNVLTIALQVPIDALTDGAKSAPAHGKGSVISVWVSTSRKKATGGDKKWSQVGRAGMPLLNELFVPFAGRDAHNEARPKADAKSLAPVLDDPELARLFKVLHKLPVPSKGRTDLVKLLSFDLGIAPLDVPQAVADVVRLDVSVSPGTLAAQNRMGLLGGDPAGYPNGRRPGDDVLDITEMLAAGVLCMKGTTCDVGAVSAPLGDGVDANDRPFSTVFPYLATPHSGSHGTLHVPAAPKKTR